MFKILKFREPRRLFEKVLIRSNNRNNRMVLNPIIKNNKLPCKIWNTFAKDIFEKNRININRGYIIPGEEANSDLSASVTIIKDRFTKFLLNRQTSGSDETWEKSQFQIQ